MNRRFLQSPHALPLLAFFALALFYWSRVLIGGQVLLPGEFLRGFAPFGNDAQAPWNILQWDALAQYYPWRHFAGEELRAGRIPLWNPYQFSGTPLMANGQSAVFYPLSLPFWIFDTAYAFGISALLHTVLAGWSTYFLAQHWKLSRAASVLAAIVYGFCGYLAAWITLPTLANTASWLPLLILLFERAVETNNARRFVLLVLTLCSALLAGHAQVFFYLILALALRALTMHRIWRAIRVLALAGICSALLGALQLLPTLELARLGHRAAQGGPTSESWNYVRENLAMKFDQISSLFLPFQTSASFDENKGYIGIIATLLVLFAFSIYGRKERREKGLSPLIYATVLTVFGLMYALATPLTALFYFGVPGISQMGGPGRALLLWSFGVALLAAFGLDALRTKVSTQVVSLLAILLVCGELFAATWNTQPTAPRAAIYPQNEVTQFLQANLKEGQRVLFLTPRMGWLPPEYLQQSGRNHPPGVLPPNGATVYRIPDVSGYDSLSLRAYREYVSQGEIFNDRDATVSPPFNGNMILLNNPLSPKLDELGVLYIASTQQLPSAAGKVVLQANDCFIYERQVKSSSQQSGCNFAPGCNDGVYQPQSFRTGVFLTLMALGFLSTLFFSARKVQENE